MDWGQAVWTRKGGRRESSSRRDAECTRMRGLYACAGSAADADAETDAGARTDERGTDR